MGRVYKIGDKMNLVPEKAVEKLIGWNEPAKRSDIAYDRKSCFTWLLSLVGKEQLAASNVDSTIMDFIKGTASFHSLNVFIVVMDILLTKCKYFF